MDFYETLYGKCHDCTFSVITLPDKGVRHFETIASMQEEIGRVGDIRNTYIPVAETQRHQRWRARRFGRHHVCHLPFRRH